MPVTVTFDCDTEAEAASLRQAAAFLAEMHQLAQAAPAGGALAALEGCALDSGRRLLREALQAAAQARVDADEAKGGRPAAARARPRPRSAARGGTAAT